MMMASPRPTRFAGVVVEVLNFLMTPGSKVRLIHQVIIMTLWSGINRRTAPWVKVPV